MPLAIRADAGFALPALYDYCECEGITYTIGLVTNQRLRDHAAPLLAEAQEESVRRGGAKVRRLGEAVHQAKTWPVPRRVVVKAEILTKNANTRYEVVQVERLFYGTLGVQPGGDTVGGRMPPATCRGCST